MAQDMHDPTQPADTTTSPTAYGWCAWHQAYSRGVRLVRVNEEGSGSSGSLFACHPCRETHRLVPLADQP